MGKLRGYPAPQAPAQQGIDKQVFYLHESAFFPKLSCAAEKAFAESARAPRDSAEPKTAGAGLAGQSRGEWPLTPIVICSCQSLLR